MSLALNSVTGIPSFNDFLTSFHPNPAVLIVIGVIIVFFVAVFAVKGTGGTETGKATTGGLTVLLAGLFVVLLLMNGMAYFFNFNVTTGLTNLFSPTPEVVVQANGSSVGNSDETQATASGDGDSGGNETTVPEIKVTPQVFHVPGNKYGFRDAQAICAAYGGRLAKIQEVQAAYQDGASWCSYGWSDGQMALFPTQQAQWEALQKIPGHKHDCGRPGVNGGYIANPNVRFGVNCYGYKPKITSDEQDAMDSAQYYPKTAREIDFDRRVSYWRHRLSELQVAPFAPNQWSEV